MAVAFKTALGNNFNNTSGTSLVITTTAAIAVDDFIVVRWASDNLNATTPTATCSDGSNTYLIQRQAAVNATAAAGCAGGILTAKATVAKASGSTITLTFSGAITGKAAYAESFTGVDNTTRCPPNGTTGTAAGATAGTIGTSPALVAGDLVLGFIANETRAFGTTGDTDTSGGAWSTLVKVAGGGTSGQDATSVTIAGQYKIVTAGGTQTFDLTAVASEWVSGVIGMVATPDPAITQAAYQFFDDAGTESGAASLAALNTAVTGNLANGDGFGTIRVRLQSTTGQAVPAADDFTLQWEKNASGSWNNAVSSVLADSYAEANRSSFLTLGQNGPPLISVEGQSIMGNGQPLLQIRMMMLRVGLPTGPVVGTVYAHTGTFGSGMGTGAVLAQSTNTVTMDTVDGAFFTWYDFNFDGSFTLVNGTPYVIALTTTQSSGSAYCRVGSDNTTPTHAGCATNLTGAAWAAVTTQDLIFELYTGVANGAVIEYANPNLTEGQATTNRLGAGTGSFVAGKVTEDSTVDDMGWSGNNYTELLFSVKLLAAQLAGGDVLRFRVLRNGSTATMTYSVTPTINIAAPYNEKLRSIPIDATVTCTDNYTHTPQAYKELVDAPYLFPTTARVTTPDPGVLPTTGFVLVMKIRGPKAASVWTVVHQGSVDGQISWRLNRSGPGGGSAGNFGLAAYPAGTFASGVFAASTGGVTLDTVNPEYLSISYVQSTRAWAVKRSTDGGVTYPTTVTNSTGSATSFFDSNSVVEIGSDQADSSIWDDRIYSVELRDGVDPVGGTVLWCFKASDYPGSGTSYADPRGRTWTLGSAAAIVPASMTINIAATVTCTDTLTGGSVKYTETGLSITIAAATTVPTEKAGRKELALSVPIVGTTTITTLVKDREISLSIPIAGTTTTTARSGNKELALSLAIAGTTTTTSTAHYKEAGGAVISPYLFTEDWNTADDTHWDWAKWPVQRPWAPISGNRGNVPGSGGPTVVAADKYVTDFEMTVKMSWDGANPAYPEIAWRLFDGLGGYGGSGGYVIQIWPSGFVQMVKVGGYNTLGAGTSTVTDASLSAAGTRWFKVRVVGTSHKVKWWNDGAGEPGTWQLDATDTVPQTDTQGAPIVGGTIGFRNYGSPPNYYVDDLTVVDLASPPLPVTDGSMRMLSNGKAIAMNGSSNALSSDTDLTWCGWVRYEGRSANGAALWSLFSGEGATPPYCITAVAPDGAIRQYMDDGDFVAGYNVPLNTWVFIALVRRITGGSDLYWAPAGTSTLSTVHGSVKGTVTGLRMRVLSDEYGSNPYSMGCAFKCWTAALTQAQLEAEMTTYAVQRTANLFLHYSMRDGLFYAPDNDPLNDSKWLWWEAGGFVSGPVATHLLDAPVAPAGAAGLTLAIAATITETDVPGTGAQHYTETGRSITITATTTTGTDRAHFRNATYFRPALLSYDFAETGTTVTDRSGNGRNATLTSDLHSNGELLFTAANQRLSYTPDAAALPQFASVTMKVRTGPYFTSSSIWTKMRISNSSNFNLYTDGVTLSAVVRGTTVVGPSIIATGTGNVGPSMAAADTTFQVALTYDGTTTRMYLNGVQTNTANTASGPLDMTGTDTTWAIGDSVLDTSTTPQNPIYFDDVRFFDFALTAAEVAYAAITPVITGLADLSITATATVTCTDVIHRKEIGLSLPIAGTVTPPTNRLNNKETALSVPIVTTVTVADAFGHLGNFSDLNLTVPIGATVTLSIDQADLDELVLSIPVVGAVTPTAKQGNKELALSVPITETDSLTARQGNKELALSIPVTGAVTVTDFIHRKELALSLPISGTTTLTVDQAHLRETALSVPVVGTTTVTTAIKVREPSLSVTIVGTTTLAVDRAGYKNPLASVPVVGVVTVVDLQQSPGHFDETQRSVLVAGTTTLTTDQARYHPSPVSLPVVASFATTDSRHTFEPSLSLPIAATVSIVTLMHNREAVSLPIAATTALSVDQADFEEHPVSLGITATVTCIDKTAGAVQQLSVLATATVTVTSQVHSQQLALPVDVSAAVIGTDALGVLALFALLITATITGTDLKSRTGVTILNDADALFLGDEMVDAIFVGEVQAWP